MDEQDEYNKDSQKRGMDAPDHYVDFSKYTTTSDIQEEIKKLEQDIAIRRRVRKRMGMSSDDENILIIDEKINVLYAEKKKWQAEQDALGLKVLRIMLFIFVIIPVTIFNPIAGAGLIAIYIFIRVLIRKARRKKAGAKKSEAEVGRTLDR